MNFSVSSQSNSKQTPLFTVTSFLQSMWFAEICIIGATVARTIARNQTCLYNYWNTRNLLEFNWSSLKSLVNATTTNASSCRNVALQPRCRESVYNDYWDSVQRNTIVWRRKVNNGALTACSTRKAENFMHHAESDAYWRPGKGRAAFW